MYEQRDRSVPRKHHHCVAHGTAVPTHMIAHNQTFTTPGDYLNSCYLVRHLVSFVESLISLEI